MRGKASFEELLVDPDARKKLPLPQLADFVNKVLALTKGFGNTRLPKRPADFAAKLSGGRWKHAKHLDHLSDRLEALHRREIQGLIVSMPPRHGKSTLIDVNFPIYWLVNNPTHHVALCTYGERFAGTWGAKVRDIIIEHMDVLNLHVKHDRMAADDWELTTGGGMLSVGIEGGITGRGADLLIIDDPIKNEEEALSENQREKVWDWWQATATTRMEPSGVFLIVATRWHEDDLIGRLLLNLPEGFEVLNLPAIAGEDDVLGREEGEMLWPERFFDDAGYARRKAKLSPYWWSALYQQRPSPEGGGLFRDEWWQFYQELPADIDQWIQTWDLSMKDNESSDPSAGQVWARKGAQLFLVNSIVGHFSLNEIAAHMKAFSAQYPKALAKLVEDTALGPALKATLQHEVQGIIPIVPKGSKFARANNVIPLLQAHNVFIPGNNLLDCPTWVQQLTHECSAFPKGANDDQVDALSQALAFLQPQKWRHDAREAEEVRKANIPVLDPAEARRVFMKKRFAKAMKLSERKHNQDHRPRFAKMW